MLNKLSRYLLLTAAIAVGSLGSAFGSTLSGATAFNVNSDGSWNNGGVTATSGCCQFIEMEVGTYTDGNNPVSLPLTLSDGNYTVYFESADWTNGFGVTHGGFNLFFNGSSTPGISVYIDPVFDQTDFSQSFGVTGAGLDTASLNNTIVGASGTSVFTSGGLTITLTGLQWVGGGSQSSYNSALTVQRVDFTVSGAGTNPVPEPASLGLLGTGIGLLGLVWRKRRA